MVLTTPTAVTPPGPAWRWGPAGHDVQLARAISDLTTGGFIGSTREALSVLRVDYDFDRRAYCTSVLAAVIVRRRLDCAARWLAEEPKSVDALLLHARVLAVRAIHAARADAPYASALTAQAAAACRNAAHAAPHDPTPWVALLSLGEADPDLPELVATGETPDKLEVDGPWGLLDEITGRDPYNREAFHRLIPRCSAPPPPVWTPATADLEPAIVDDLTARAQVAVWAAERAPVHSPLQVLRLMHSADRDPFSNAGEQLRLAHYLKANGPGSREEYLRERTPAIEEHWRTGLRSGAVKLAETWFTFSRQPPYMPLSDISFLARYLHQVGESAAARLALEWMIPHASVEPWHRDGDPGAVLTRVCLDCHILPSSLPR